MDQAGGIGHAATGQVERRAVIDRHPRIRQAQGDVDCLLKACVLEHGQSLIVIHRQDCVEVDQHLRQKCAVGGQRSTQIQSLGAQRENHRLDDLDFFTAKNAAFPCMRIQSQHRNPWLCDSELGAQCGMQNAQADGERLAADRIRDGTQGQVSGRQCHPQARAGKHHHDACAGLFGQQFGGAAVGNSARIDAGFVDGAGDQPIAIAVDTGLTATRERSDYRPCIGRVSPAKARACGLLDRDQRQRAGSRRVVCGQQFKRQAKCLRGRQHGVGIGVSHHIARQVALGQSHTQLRTNTAGLAGHQCKSRTLPHA